MKFKAILCSLLCMAMVGCSSNDAEEQEVNLTDPVKEKQKEVIVIHDRVMKHMPRLGKMSNELMEVGEGREDSIEYYSHAADVDLAKDLMMRWMRNYKEPEGLQMTIEEKIEYLEKEKKEMEEIENFTEKVLRKGEEMLRSAAPQTASK